MLREARTWEVVDMPKDANVIGSKWVFRAKKDATGDVVRYKARLVAQVSPKFLGSTILTHLHQWHD